MVDFTITVSSELAALFPQAVNYYNNKYGTEYNNQDMVKKLAIDFIADCLRDLEQIEMESRYAAALEGVPEFE